MPREEACYSIIKVRDKRKVKPFGITIVVPNKGILAKRINQDCRYDPLFIAYFQYLDTINKEKLIWDENIKNCIRCDSPEGLMCLFRFMQGSRLFLSIPQIVPICPDKIIQNANKIMACVCLLS